jgi:hypothetical protein
MRDYPTLHLDTKQRKVAAYTNKGNMRDYPTLQLCV